MISKKVILIGFLIILISPIIFIIATFKQQLGRTGLLTIDHLDMIKDQGLLDLGNAENYLAQIYYRVGYLDWSTELIANRQKFANVINGQYYIASIVDNVLTPGYDVFGTVMASHTFYYIKKGISLPDRALIAEEYQSDQIGIYGEYYVLFYGYPALAIFFISAFMFQRIFINLKATNALLVCMYRAVLLHLFYFWMNSFGMDWFAMNIVMAIATTFLFARYYISNNKRKFVFRMSRKGMWSKLD